MSDQFKNESDRRREPRFNQRIKVRFRCGDERWRTGVTGDISYGGMFITSKALPDSEYVEIKLAHRRQRLILKGKVIRASNPAASAAKSPPCGFAVELVDQPDTWLELCRAMRQGLPRERRTTELTAPKPEAD